MTPNTIGKVIMLVVWAVLLANVVVDFPENMDSWLYALAGLIAAIHLALCVVFAPKVPAHHKNSALGYLLIFLFGIIHVGGWH